MASQERKPDKNVASSPQSKRKEMTNEERLVETEERLAESEVSSVESEARIAESEVSSVDSEEILVESEDSSVESEDSSVESEENSVESEERPLGSGKRIPDKVEVGSSSVDRALEELLPKPIVGIDLGTCTSCVGILSNGRVKILSVEEGAQTILHSYVAFEDPNEGMEAYQVMVGAKYHQVEERVASCAKRLLGRGFEDDQVQNEIVGWPCKVINDNDRPKYLMEHNGKETTYFPEEISAYVLERLKTVVEDHTNEKVKKVVITVPACFNQNQRKATRIAAQLAGLEVMNFLSEPCAAAVAYAMELDLQKEKNQKVLVFDFGGGTLDVTILELSKDQFRVIAIGGDPHLGGEDIDVIMAEHFLQKFNSRTEFNVSRDDSMVWRRLKRQSEMTKMVLSKSFVSKSALENLIGDVLQRSMSTLEEVFTSSGVDKDSIDKVLMVGGTCKIPKIRKNLVKCFGESKVIGIPAYVDQAVTKGATIMAAHMSGRRTEYPSVPLQDVLPLSMGFSNPNGKVVHFMNRNAPVPAEAPVLFSTRQDNQTFLNLSVYEGEDEIAENNFFIGEMRMGGIPPAPAGKPRVRITFKVDLDGNLTASAVATGCGIRKQLSCHYHRTGMTEEDISLVLQSKNMDLRAQR